VTSFFGITGAIFSKMTRRICTNFFSGFRKIHLFITICIKKQCTRARWAPGCMPSAPCNPPLMIKQREAY